MAEREYIDTDVVIVGAGPAGLAAAIRLKQLRPESPPLTELLYPILPEYM